MIRFVVDILFVVIFLICSIPVWGILYIWGLFDKKSSKRASMAIVCWAFRVVWHIAGVKPVIQGRENIPKDEPLLYVANHQSLFDIVMTYSLMPDVTGFLSKETFKKVPLLNVWMILNYCLFLTRDNPREDLKIILKAIDFVKLGVSMFVFPEGTRSKNGEVIEFHEAPMKISTKTGCKVIPVAITGTRDVFENHAPFFRRRKVVITFCDAVDLKTLEGEDKKKPGAYCRNIIIKQLEADKELMS